MPPVVQSLSSTCSWHSPPLFSLEDGAPELSAPRSDDRTAFGLATQAEQSVSGKNWPFLQKCAVRQVFNTVQIWGTVFTLKLFCCNWDNSQQKGADDLSFHSRNTMSHIFKNYQFGLKEEEKKTWPAAKSLPSVLKKKKDWEKLCIVAWISSPSSACLGTWHGWGLVLPFKVQQKFVSSSSREEWCTGEFSVVLWGYLDWRSVPC